MLKKDADGAYVSIKTDEQVEFCSYVLVNGIRFNKESDYAANTRLGLTDPKTGHTYGCSCFICNH
jgi:hypothetical protein